MDRLEPESSEWWRWAEMNMVYLYPLFIKPVALAGSMGKAFLDCSGDLKVYHEMVIDRLQQI